MKKQQSQVYNFKTALIIGIALSVVTFFIYYFSNPNYQSFFDYTFRVAKALLNGNVGLSSQPPKWLNEFVPFGGKWYSVFPLGGVLSMIPFAIFAKEMPGALIAGLQASSISLFLFLISLQYNLSWFKRILFVLAIVLGTWMWTNVTFGGAWQLALGFAMLGQLGALYFSVYKPKPILAGIFFALGFGNRTEVLLTAPILLFLLLRATNPNFISTKLNSYFNKQSLKIILAFCAIPILLGVNTLFYNNARFSSPFDFGYARIPGVLEEPWYDHGIFSPTYIPRQAKEMLLSPWVKTQEFPYRKPGGFHSSILLSSPFLLLLLRVRSKNKVLIRAAWLVIILLTFLLWIHGNSGGWQFGYRYAMVLLPWIYILLLENSNQKVKWYELVLILFSILANGYATYLFHWTQKITP